MPVIVDTTNVLVHQGLPFANDEQFLEAALPFLREARGGAVVISEHAGLLREALGDAAAEVEFVDPVTWFDAPARTLTGCLACARDRWWPRGPLSLLAEPVWRGRTPLEIREWERFESLLNVAFAGTPSRLLCAYDLRSVPSRVADRVGRTHPELAGPGGSRRSPDFTDPAAFYAECNRDPLAPPPETVEGREFAGGGLPGVRAFVRAAAGRAGLPYERRLALVQSVGEVATHIVRGGGGRGAVWLWCDGDEVICDVVDAGGTLDDHFLGYFPPAPYRPAGAGMWAVRQLCDLVEIRSGEPGTVVRLHMRRDRR